MMKRIFAAALWMALLGCAPVAAAQQGFQGRYFPEKRDYLVGEPIVIDLEIQNHGRQVGQIGESSCDDLRPSPFEVEGAARRKKAPPFVCGPEAFAGSCLVGSDEIRPGGKYVKRLFLNGPFTLNFPGTYRVRAASEERIGRAGGGEVLADLQIESEFEITLRAPGEGELDAAYKPYFNDLKSKDTDIRYFAAEALTQDPPGFAEAVITALAANPITAALAAEGLGRLGTPTARAKLIEMGSSDSNMAQQIAIQALGELGNPDDCQALLDIGDKNKNWTQGEGYTYAGRVCKQRAIPALLRLLPDADALFSGYLAGALANTQSRDAVAPLIGLLTNSDIGARRNAAEALATLTHRKSRYEIDNAESSNDAHLEWLKWWDANRDAAPMYGPDECVDPEPLI